MRNRPALYLLILGLFYGNISLLSAQSLLASDSNLIRIKGTVKDEKGNRLPFVCVKQPQKGCTLLTDEKGDFTAEISKVALLIISSPGYEDISLRLEKEGEQVIILHKKEEAGSFEESGSHTLAGGLSEMKELDSLYANDIIVSRDLFIPDSLMGFSVFPERPFSRSMINLGVQLLPAGEFSLTMVNEAGAVAWQRWIQVANGNKLIALQLPDLPSGPYYIVLDLGKGKYVQKKIFLCK